MDILRQKNLEIGEAYKVNPPTKQEMKMENTPSGDWMMPSICLTEKQLPEITDWEVGQEYVIVLEATMTSKSQDKMGVDAYFKVKAIAIPVEDATEKASPEDVAEKT